MGRGREYYGYNCKPASYVCGIGHTDRILLPGKKKIFVLKRLRHDDEKFSRKHAPTTPFFACVHKNDPPRYMCNAYFTAVLHGKRGYGLSVFAPVRRIRWS